MRADKYGNKKWYQVANELIGRENVQKLIKAGISLRCSDELRKLEKLCDEQAVIISSSIRLNPREHQDA